MIQPVYHLCANSRSRLAWSNFDEQYKSPAVAKVSRPYWWCTLATCVHNYQRLKTHVFTKSFFWLFPGLDFTSLPNLSLVDLAVVCITLATLKIPDWLIDWLTDWLRCVAASRTWRWVWGWTASCCSSWTRWQLAAMTMNGECWTSTLWRSTARLFTLLPGTPPLRQHRHPAPALCSRSVYHQLLRNIRRSIKLADFCSPIKSADKNLSSVMHNSADFVGWQNRLILSSNIKTRSILDDKVGQLSGYRSPWWLFTTGDEYLS